MKPVAAQTTIHRKRSIKSAIPGTMGTQSKVFVYQTWEEPQPLILEERFAVSVLGKYPPRGRAGSTQLDNIDQGDWDLTQSIGESFRGSMKPTRVKGPAGPGALSLSLSCPTTATSPVKSHQATD